MGYFNFSLSPTPPSTRGSLCLVGNELNEHSRPQREVLFAYLNFSLSPPPPSTRGSLCLVDNELNEYSPPQREVLFAYLNFSPKTPGRGKRPRKTADKDTPRRTSARKVAERLRKTKY